MMGFTKVVAVLHLIGNWLNTYLRQWKQKKAQAERDLSEDDPNAWFDGEFGSDGRVQQYVPPDAKRTNQTNADKN
jgi:hypothetical protein